MILNMIVLSLLGYGTWLFYVYVEKKGWIVTTTHPYTNKKTYTYYWEFVRVLILFVAAILFLFYQRWMVSVVAFCITIIYLYTVVLNNKKDKNEKVIAVWEYDKETMKEWKDWIIEKRKEDGIKNKRIMKKTSKKVVITSKYIYFSKKKRIPITRDDFRYLKIDKIEEKEGVLFLTYSYLTVPVRVYAIFMGTKEKNKFFKDLSDVGIICYNQGKK